MRRLRVGVAGLGVGAQHARAYAALSDCELRWLCDLDEERARALAARFDRPRVTTRFETLLEDPELDLISIATFDDAHAGQVRAALEAGKHVFVEKPLCRTAGELAAIARAWRATGEPRWLASNLVLRGAPLYRWLHARLREGSFGRLYALDGDYLWGRLEKLTRGWRGRIPDYSVLLGGGVHLIDLLLWLAGERPTHVQSIGNRICTEATPVCAADFAAATFEFPSGLVGRVSANFGCVHPHQHVLRVFGTERSLVSDDAGARLYRSRDPAVGPEPVPADPQPDSKGALIPELVRGIQANEDPAAVARQLFDTMSAALAAARALRDGERVAVEYV